MGSRLQAQELPQTLEGAGTISLCLEDRVASRGAGGGGAGAENWNPLYPPSAAAHGPQVSRTSQSVE